MDTSKLTQHLKPVCEICSSRNLRVLSEVCLYLGFLSIVAAVATWFTATKENRAYGERFGIFVGLWAPTFLILSNRLARFADEKK